MTQEEKRQKIAEACGWTRGEDPHYPWVNPTTGNWTRPLNWRTLPDYFNDLNACAEAFRSLKLPQQCKWHEELRKVLKKKAACNIDDASIDWLCDNATAEQRAEAFGLTLGLWQEGE